MSELDLGLIQMLEANRLRYQLVLTKVDSVPMHHLQGLIDSLAKTKPLRPLAMPWTLSTSTKTGSGVDDLRKLLLHYAALLANN